MVGAGAPALEEQMPTDALDNTGPQTCKDDVSDASPYATEVIKSYEEKRRALTEQYLNELPGPEASTGFKDVRVSLRVGVDGKGHDYGMTHRLSWEELSQRRGPHKILLGTLYDSRGWLNGETEVQHIICCGKCGVTNRLNAKITDPVGSVMDAFSCLCTSVVTYNEVEERQKAIAQSVASIKNAERQERVSETVDRLWGKIADGVKMREMKIQYIGVDEAVPATRAARELGVENPAAEQEMDTVLCYRGVKYYQGICGQCAATEVFVGADNFCVECLEKVGATISQDEAGEMRRAMLGGEIRKMYPGT